MNIQVIRFPWGACSGIARSARVAEDGYGAVSVRLHGAHRWMRVAICFARDSQGRNICIGNKYTYVVRCDCKRANWNYKHNHVRHCPHTYAVDQAIQQGVVDAQRVLAARTVWSGPQPPSIQLGA